MNTKKAPDPKMGRKLVWYDDFSSGVLDTAKWKMTPTMKNPDSVYDNSGEYVEVKDGLLRMYVRKTGRENLPFSLPQGLTTKERMIFRYGYVEARLKIPFRHGAWPSFWMKTDTPRAKAEYMAEIDIIEVFSSPNEVVNNLHKWGGGQHVMLPGGEGSSNRAFRFSDCEKLNDEFHIYGMEWDENFISFYVDGEMYSRHSIKEDFSPEVLPGMAGFHDFGYIIFNNEIFTENSRWKPGNAALTGQEPFPIVYTIDWVRLYQDPARESIETGAGNEPL